MLYRWIAPACHVNSSMEHSHRATEHRVARRSATKTASKTISSTVTSPLESCAKDRIAWRALTRKACSNFESSQRDCITRARECRKASASAPAADSFQCPLQASQNPLLVIWQCQASQNPSPSNLAVSG